MSGLFLLMMLIIIGRLFYMQVIQHESYLAQAESEQVKSLTIPAERGEIYALDNGEPVKLVLNETVYTVFADPQEVTDVAGIIETMKSVAGGNVVDNFESLIDDKPSRYKVIARNVTQKQAELIKEKQYRGLGFQKTTRRVYPEAQLASQTLGFVNTESKGQYGVEQALDDQLQGKDGRLRAVTDVGNVPLTIGKQNIREPARNGRNVVLTIDRNIQAYTEKALADGLKRSGANKGSVIVMDPQSGKVMAMANLPTYNPEKYNEVTDPAAFNNGTIMSPYEPGSVIKTFTLATGIDKNVVSPSSTYNNTDTIQVDDAVIGNATRGQTGTITMQHALNYSLNTGMVTVAQRLGDGSRITYGARTTMYDYFHNNFGFGEKTGIELAYEAKGLVISPDEVQGNAVRYSNMSFGQGMDLTMVQVAAGFGSIVNGGKYYKPTIIAGTVTADDEYQPAPASSPLRTTLSEQSARQTKEMVRTARSAFNNSMDKPGYDVGGKTGTSETLVNGNYDDQVTIASYLGYGGDTAPKYVIMVQVSADGKYLGGNTDAMPIFTDISNWMIDYMKLQPST